MIPITSWSQNLVSGSYYNFPLPEPYVGYAADRSDSGDGVPIDGLNNIVVQLGSTSNVLYGSVGAYAQIQKNNFADVIIIDTIENTRT